MKPTMALSSAVFDLKYSLRFVDCIAVFPERHTSG